MVPTKYSCSKCSGGGTQHHLVRGVVSSTHLFSDAKSVDYSLYCSGLVPYRTDSRRSLLPHPVSCLLFPRALPSLLPAANSTPVASLPLSCLPCHWVPKLLRRCSIRRLRKACLREGPHLPLPLRLALERWVAEAGE